MLVMDDGWFGRRNDDTNSLGDWFVNEKKLPGGLGELIRRVNELGLKFGIWYEPEMISPDSDLYRAHPDWCLHVPGRARSLGRHQLILDMTRQDVRDNIFEQMSSVLSQNKIDYLKWDFNRNITEAGSALLPAERQQEVFHRFVLGTYELMDRLTKAFPDLLIENCSGGGGRFDPGMLYFSPQIWCSDNTDAIERLTIQFGTSLCYPPSCMGAHVSANRRTGYTDEEKETVRRQVADYHKYYNLTHFGDFYRLIAPTDNTFRCAWGHVAPDKSEALFTAVIIRRPESSAFPLRLKGLDPNKTYTCEALDLTRSGAALMNAGLNLTRMSQNDGDSLALYFKAIDA